MSENDPKPKPPSSRLLWIGSGFAIVISAMAVASYRPAAELNAAPGSPLYGRAVHEAIQGLAGVGKGGAGGPGGARPPLPAGLSAEDHYWCANCKTYHKRQPPEAIGPDGVPASIARPPAPGTRPPAPAGQAATPAGAQPPLPAGVSADEVYWCADCKAYHKRSGQAAPAHGAAPAGAAKPPLPAGVSADDVYWCANCKSYHRKGTHQAPAAVPGSPAPAPALPTPPSESE